MREFLDSWRVNFEGMSQNPAQAVKADTTSKADRAVRAVRADMSQVEVEPIQTVRTDLYLSESWWALCTVRCAVEHDRYPMHVLENMRVHIRENFSIASQNTGNDVYCMETWRKYAIVRRNDAFRFEFVIAFRLFLYIACGRGLWSTSVDRKMKDIWLAPSWVASNRLESSKLVDPFYDTIVELYEHVVTRVNRGEKNYVRKPEEPQASQVSLRGLKRPLSTTTTRAAFYRPSRAHRPSCPCFDCCEH